MAKRSSSATNALQRGREESPWRAALQMRAVWECLRSRSRHPAPEGPQRGPALSARSAAGPSGGASELHTRERLSQGPGCCTAFGCRLILSGESTPGGSLARAAVRLGLLSQSSHGEQRLPPALAEAPLQGSGATPAAAPPPPFFASFPRPAVVPTSTPCCCQRLEHPPALPRRLSSAWRPPGVLTPSGPSAALSQHPVGPINLS